MNRVRRRVEEQRRAGDGPAVARFRGVVAEQDVYIRNGRVRVARLLLVRPFDPHTRVSSLPAVRIGLRYRLQLADGNVHNNAVIFAEVLLPFAAYKEIGTGRPGPLAEIQVLFDTVPNGRVEVAGGEDVDGRARGHCDIGNDEARVVGGHVVVDRVWENAVVTVEDEDSDKSEGHHRGELEDRAEL